MKTYKVAAVYGLLWCLAAIGTIVWAAESAPATWWGYLKIAMGGVGAGVFGVFTYMRDPNKAWEVMPSVGAKPLPGGKP